MLSEKARQFYLEDNCNCSESVVQAANACGKFGLDEKALKMVSGFGKGCGCGDLCGAVAGALSVLSLLTVEGSAHTTPDFDKLCAGLMAKLKEALHGVHCAQVKPNFFQPEIRCANCVATAAQVLENYLKEIGKCPCKK